MNNIKQELNDKSIKYPSRIISFLKDRDEPSDIEKIRVDCGIANWQTALKHCLELLIKGEIRGQKTSKSWIFWVEKNPAIIILDYLSDRELVTTDELDILPDKGVVNELIWCNALTEIYPEIFRVNKEKLKSWAEDSGLGGKKYEVDS